MSSLFSNNCYFDSNPYVLSQFQVKPFPPLFDAMQTYEQELKTGAPVQAFTTSYNIQNHIKQMNHYDFGRIHQIEQNHSSSKKISLLGISEKKSKLLLSDNRVGIKFLNSNSTDKKVNLKHLAKIKEKNGRKGNHMNLIYNKNQSSTGLRQMNNDIFTQNDININKNNNNNLILHIKKNMNENKTIIL